tara:strand:+ start:1412 stop:1579 length:168 start_codon:yes stop_codon:yes gene_type:complete
MNENLFKQIKFPTREKLLEYRYEQFQEWINKCPLVITDYQDFTDRFQITFDLEAD